MTVFILYAWGAWIGFNVFMVLLSCLVLKPRQPCFNGFSIMIPAWVRQVLTDDEMQAVIAHERGHRHHGHIWKNFFWRLVFLTRNQTQRLYQEFEADDFAAAEGRALHLAVALRKLSRHPDDVLRSERLLQRMGI